ncbi:MAG: hypothetical protein KKF56_03735 [Nanoarchaeota archaeon]|nr:hypothetical protein [Nanoarchaeota archaeon]
MEDLLGRLLETAEDIVLMRDVPALNSDQVSFAVPLRGKLAREVFDESLTHDRGLPEFQRYWSFDKSSGHIKGLSVYLGTRLDSRVLRPEGLRMLGVRELQSLGGKGKLADGFWRDAGIVVYSAGTPNLNTARALCQKGVEGELDLPLIWGFSDLDYVPKDGGVGIVSIENPQRVILGEEAVKVLEDIEAYQGNKKGACRLSRGGGGDWGADWVVFADSDAGCLVDWVCGEATREKLLQAYNGLSERVYGDQIEELQTKRDSSRHEFLAELDR